MNTASASIVELKGQLNNLTAKLQEMETAERSELANKVSSLPTYLGVNSMEEAITVIRRFRNNSVHGRSIRHIQSARGGQNIGKRVWGKGRVVPDNLRRNVVDLLKMKDFTVEEISNKIGVSTATINKIKKSIGMVKTRSHQPLGVAAG